MTTGQRTRLAALREKHPALTYAGFDCDVANGTLEIEYSFLLEPDVRFRPRLTITGGDWVRQGEDLASTVFQLGLVELISYWKAACPPTIRIEAGRLSEHQADWWRHLFLHGLGEFLYVNQIAPDPAGLVRFEVPGTNGRDRSPARTAPPGDGVLALASGGKDSAVMLEVLRATTPPRALLMLNPTRAAMDVASRAGMHDRVVARRQIDTTLLDLNRAGYLNGHTPFSAYLAFLGLVVAAGQGFAAIVAANERSADEPTLMAGTQPVNHQYSKTLDFESRFRSYVDRQLHMPVEYFSLLRPLYDLQIARALAGLRQYHDVFRSCNAAQAANEWCGRCSKCAFVYLILSPFLPQKEMRAIFGTDCFEVPELRSVFRQLVGLEATKPFDCVGSVEECRAACILTAAACRRRGADVPPTVEAILADLSCAQVDTGEPKALDLLSSWSPQHHLPPLHESHLRTRIPLGIDA